MNKYRFIIDKIDYIIRSVIVLVSILVIGAIVVDYGFILNEKEYQLVYGVYDIGWWTYIISFTMQLIFRWSQIRKKALSLTTILGLALYLSALPKIFALTDQSGWIADVFTFLENKFFVIPMLAVFAFIELSRWVSKFVNKRTNPALLTVLCFAIIIIFGALLLMLPRSTMDHIQLPIIDALFTSTSAVCVTGLSTVDVSSTFTLEGQIIIALLIQIGGLGIMTITTFFAVFFMDGLGLYSQFALKDMLSSGAESLISTLLYVFGFTIVIEAIGAFAIWSSIHPLEGMTLNEEIFFSIFHSVSAFCNAGFSTVEGGLGNETIFSNYNVFYIIISILIVLGGIGFPILINLKRQFSYYITSIYHRLRNKNSRLTRYPHIVDLNTKIVLWTTLILILFGAASILFLEWNSTFAEFSTGKKIVQALFNSIVPRTAGFNSVTISDFSRITIMLIIVLMWIGGASQSTAGGIKVNTLAVAFASVKSLIKGERATILFNREITYNTLRRTLAIIFGSLFVISIFFISILALEPEYSPMEILFECVSAFSTVGLSLGITPYICDTSRLLLVLLMFIGRVGFITVMMSIVSRKERNKYRLPKEDIIIN